MTQSVAPLILPARQRTVEETNAAQGMAQFLQQRKEDLCLAERVESALRATGCEQLRGVEVTVHTQLVILGGRVPSYYLKQVAQTTALAVPGVRHLRNDLDVVPPN